MAGDAGAAAVIFDVDGVLVASPHERAWREALDELVREGGTPPGTWRPERFTSAVYKAVAAGKPRLAGARALLEHFGIPDAAARAHDYAARKQRRLELLIERGEFEAFPDALRLVARLRERRVPLAAASSSKNANRLLARVRPDGSLVKNGGARGETLLDVFAANVSGRDLPYGKPDPQIFLVAAEELGVPPDRCAVVEDAPAGVLAGKAAGMTAIGVARGADGRMLQAAGADAVVSTLDDLPADALVGRGDGGVAAPPAGDRAGLEECVATAMTPTADPAWVLRQTGYSPLTEPDIESRFAIANGFIGVRGARALSRGPMWVAFLHTLSWASWPRIFVAGLYDTPNTEPPVPVLAPAPDWLRVRVLLDDEPLVLRAGELIAHTRTLDLRRGVLLLGWHQRAPGGQVLRSRSLRMVSLADRPLGIQLVELTIDGGPAAVTFEAALEVANSGLDLCRMEDAAAIWRTAMSGKCLAIASAAELRLGDAPLGPAIDTQLEREWRWTSAPGQRATFWRIVSLARRDEDDDGAGPAARAPLARGVRTGWVRLLDAHVAAWEARWDASDVRVEGDDEAQRALRFAVYHLNAAPNPGDERVSIGARGLTGDAYLGHVFWDTEIYLLPFYVHTWPAAARALLMYRWHTLPAAREKAERLGWRGALYAWESADTGEETTPTQIVDGEGRLIDVLAGTLEQHVSADVAHAVWRYWRATGDDDFLLRAGAEILLDTARFWASRAVLEPDGAYHIRHVIGPDEYHEDVDDNAFTNVMAAWNVARALDVAALLRARHRDRWQALATALALDGDELRRWRDVAARLHTGIDLRTGLLEQFRGYFDLEDVDLTRYADREAPMDVILGRQRVARTQVVKQADVVALLALLPELFSRRIVAANYGYYAPRCAHGSSLSRSMHAVVAARLGEVDEAARYFRETGALDLTDRRGGAGGVRMAALGGVWQTAVLGFAGLGLRPDGVSLDPHIPASWRTLAFPFQWRGRRVRVALDGRTRTVTATLEQGAPMTLAVGERTGTLRGPTPVRATW